MIVRNRWAVNGLIITFALFGVVSFAGQRILSSLILNNRIDISSYQSYIYSFNLIVGILTSAALAVFFAGAVRGSSRGIRAGFIAGSVSVLAPIFGALSTAILFKMLRLPSMGAGSVIAAAVSTLLIILPCFVMLIIFACCKKLKRSSRVLGLIIALLSLLIAFFPLVVSVLSLVVMPGNPAMAPFMDLSAYLIHVRPIMIALGLSVVYLMNRNSSNDSNNSNSNSQSDLNTVVS